MLWCACPRAIRGRISIFPKKLTPLSFTPVYRGLSIAQRTRYNQLTGPLLPRANHLFLSNAWDDQSWNGLSKMAPCRSGTRPREFTDEENNHSSGFVSCFGKPKTSGGYAAGLLSAFVKGGTPFTCHS